MCNTKNVHKIFQISTSVPWEQMIVTLMQRVQTHLERLSVLVTKGTQVTESHAQVR